MSTLVGSTNARGSGPKSRPAHPVDAALWGLAERLAGASEPIEPDAVVADADGGEFVGRRSSQVRVVRLPQRAGGLPSVGRMAQRNRTTVAPAVGVPTKPITADSGRTKSKPAALPEKSPRRKQTEAPKTALRIRRAEFTILKGRNGIERRQSASQADVNSGIRQESPASGEKTSGEPPNARHGDGRKRRAGVTFLGWLALTAVAVAAAAIALFAPSWF